MRGGVGRGVIGEGGLSLSFRKLTTHFLVPGPFDPSCPEMKEVLCYVCTESCHVVQLFG